MRPPRPLLAASLACFRDGKVLIARRGKPPALGLWSLPGGMVKLGENAADAAVRELHEETGVRATAVALADVVEVILRAPDGVVERHVTILAYAGRWLAGEGATGPEATEIAWARPDRLGALETTPGLAAVVARAAALLP
nr:NUDIX hydrolase [Methylopila capsulata]